MKRQLLSFGIELQSDNAILLFTNENNYLYHSDKLIKIKLNKKPELLAYGDTMVDKELLKDFEQLRSNLIMRYNKSDEYNEIDMNEFFENDCEFNITYPDLFAVNGDVLNFVLQKIIQSLSHLDLYLSNFESIPIKKFQYKSQRGRLLEIKHIPSFVISKDNTWNDLILNLKHFDRFFHILSRNQTYPQNFNIQITLGIQFNHLVDTIELFLNEYEKIPKSKKTIKDYQNNLIWFYLKEDLRVRMQYLYGYNEKDFENKILKKQKKLYTIYLIFRYIIKTRNNRKLYPFLIRHHTSSILKLLTLNEMETFLNWLEDKKEITLAKRAYYIKNVQDIKEMKDASLRKNLLNNLLDFEKNEFNAIFPILNKSKLIFLVEFRYIHQILNYLIDPKRQLMDYISLNDLKILDSSRRYSIEIQDEPRIVSLGNLFNQDN